MGYILYCICLILFKWGIIDIIATYILRKVPPYSLWEITYVKKIAHIFILSNTYTQKRNIEMYI